MKHYIIYSYHRQLILIANQEKEIFFKERLTLKRIKFLKANNIMEIKIKLYRKSIPTFEELLLITVINQNRKNTEAKIILISLVLIIFMKNRAKKVFRQCKNKSKNIFSIKKCTIIKLVAKTNQVFMNNLRVKCNF